MDEVPLTLDDKLAEADTERSSLNVKESLADSSSVTLTDRELDPSCDCENVEVNVGVSDAEDSSEGDLVKVVSWLSEGESVDVTVGVSESVRLSVAVGSRERLVERLASLERVVEVLKVPVKVTERDDESSLVRDCVFVEVADFVNEGSLERE